MKINKKIIVPLFASVIGLSVAGGLGGAFAWYQFNSQVTASFVGTSIAEGGLLQIGYKDDQNKTQWGRDIIKNGSNFVPVTFGALQTGDTLRAKPYGRPEAGVQRGNDYTKGWEVMSTGYYQFDIYLRALEADSSATGDPTHDVDPGYKLVTKPVYLSDIHIEGVNEAKTTAGGKHISDAVRVHLDVENNTNRLISSAAVTDMPLHGELDLDGDGESDTYGGYEWETDRDTVVNYGINTEFQTTTAAANLIQERDENGDMPESTPQNPNAKCIAYTKNGTDGYETKITVTVWLEGWQMLNNKADDPTKQGTVWNPILNAGLDARIGLTFDAGRNLGR